jgi:hypothetical protein
MDKIYEVISSETRKFEVRRKFSAANEKRHESSDVATLLDNAKGSKQNEHSFLEEEQERATSKENRNALRLPNINAKKPLPEKENELVRAETNLYRVEGKKLNMEQWNTDSKAKTTESLDDLAAKFLNVRPLKYEKSPLRAPDAVIKSLKSVKSKYPFKCESQKDGVFCDEAEEMPSEKVAGERKLKTVNKRAKKEYSISKNEGEEVLMRREKKEVKSSSISQTVQVVGKRRYSVNYLDFCLFVSLLNCYAGLPSSNASYKAFVGKGNNSILIKNTLKNRFWWNISENEADANLYWLQNRDNKFIQLLKSYTRIEKPVEEARHKFLLEKPKEPKENEKLDVIKEFTKAGFYKLMGEGEAKEQCKSQYLAEIAVEEGFNSADCANKCKLHNHFEFNWNITNKKALYYNLKRFYLATKQDPFEFIPLTYHVQTEGDTEWQRFEEHFLEKEALILQKTEGKAKKKREKNLWIIKPGENSNQGCGIQVAESLEEIKEIIKSKENLPNGRKRSHIIQRYLMPLLYNKRKFDIRCYVLVTAVNDIVKAYWYEEGYIRTSSKEFTLKNLKNRFIHLTNDAVQKKSEDYGKYENGNKVSFTDFEKYLEANYQDKTYSFYANVYPKMMVPPPNSATRRRCHSQRAFSPRLLQAGVHLRGVRAGLHDRRRVQHVADRGEQQPLPRAGLSPPRQDHPQHDRECLQDRSGPALPAAQGLPQEQGYAHRAVREQQVHADLQQLRGAGEAEGVPAGGRPQEPFQHHRERRGGGLPRGLRLIPSSIF